MFIPLIIGKDYVIKYLQNWANVIFFFFLIHLTNLIPFFAPHKRVTELYDRYFATRSLSCQLESYCVLSTTSLRSI